MKINLFWLSVDQQPPTWDHGDIISCPAEPNAIHDKIGLTPIFDDVDAWLFWDPRFPLPALKTLIELLAEKNDVFHAGLRLGYGGQPDFIDFVSPTWMLNRDPDPGIEATSWRVSLRAALIRTEVMRQMGGPLPGFETLEGASLEMGYRYIRNGVFIRHCPQLLQGFPVKPSIKLPTADQLKFIGVSFGKKWLYWAAFRAIMNRSASLSEITSAIKSALPFTRFATPPHFAHAENCGPLPVVTGKVSVLIPTVNRYPYLRTVLAQLRTQTIKPLEILVIDQTPEYDREGILKDEFQDLPIRWFEMEQAGQCTSRNTGIGEAIGEYILFIDDDDEIKPNLIESHIDNLNRYSSLISSGSALEPGTVEPNYDQFFPRINDVFPTNNSLIEKDTLLKSGLFDLAYDHGQRADHDLGMRIYLSGQKMVLDPRISVFHHHAPQGGLREHKARVITRSRSRKSLTLRVLPSPSDIYLAKRYFTEHQVREKMWISVFETFTLDGPKWKKVLKAAISLFALPLTFRKLRSNVRSAELLLQDYPQIPRLHT